MYVTIGWLASPSPVLDALPLASGTFSLDPGGLDDAAIAAVRQWQFEPGRLSGTPVDVLVTVVMDFSIR